MNLLRLINQSLMLSDSPATGDIVQTDFAYWKEYEEVAGKEKWSLVTPAMELIRPNGTSLCNGFWAWATFRGLFLISANKAHLFSGIWIFRWFIRFSWTPILICWRWKCLWGPFSWNSLIFSIVLKNKEWCIFLVWEYTFKTKIIVAFDQKYNIDWDSSEFTGYLEDFFINRFGRELYYSDSNPCNKKSCNNN